MKTRVSLLIEEEIFREAKRLAVREGRSFSGLIQDALVSYLSSKVPDPQKRKSAYQTFCEQPMRIRKKHLNEILVERAWDE